MDLHEYGSHKLVSADQAISNIRKGSRVFIGTGCGEPQHLIRAMVADMNMQDIMVYQMMSFTLADYIAEFVDSKPVYDYSDLDFCISSPMDLNNLH